MCRCHGTRERAGRQEGSAVSCWRKPASTWLPTAAPASPPTLPPAGSRRSACRTTASLPPRLWSLGQAAALTPRMRCAPRGGRQGQAAWQPQGEQGVAACSMQHVQESCCCCFRCCCCRCCCRRCCCRCCCCRRCCCRWCRCRCCRCRCRCSMRWFQVVAAPGFSFSHCQPAVPSCAGCRGAAERGA